MKVREADPERDALSIMDGLKDFVSRMCFVEMLPKDDTGLAAAIGRVLGFDGTRILVAENDDGIIGMIGLFYAPYLWNPEIMAAEELFWWTRRDAPKITALVLVRAAMGDMRRHNVRFAVFKALTSSPAGIDRVYRRMGLRPAETGYVGML